MMIMKKNKLISRTIRETCGITYTLERKNIRKLHLYVKPPDGTVLVTAPIVYPIEEIEAFIRSKEEWLRKHIRRFRERSDQEKMSLNYVNGETLYFWGRPYKLTVIEKENFTRGKAEIIPSPVFITDNAWLDRFSEFDFDQIQDFAEDYGQKSVAGWIDDEGLPFGYVSLTVPSGSTFEQREKLVKAAYKRVLDREAGHVLDFWSLKTGLAYSSWHSRWMKTRWGSLAIIDKKVSLNTRLAEKPEICLVYVALHEIAHVKEANHGPNFKTILNRYMPSWREAEKILKH